MLKYCARLSRSEGEASALSDNESDAGLHAIIATLKRREGLTDPLRAGPLKTAVENYLDALSHLLVAAGPPGQREPGYKSRSAVKGPTTDPVIGWADELVEREATWLKQQTERIHKWLESPYPTRKKSSKPCAGCGRGLAKGARFCPSCGSPTGR